MIIYVNGDSHSAGAELVKDYCFAEDDPRYTALGKTPHPECIPLTYGNHIARSLKAGCLIDAQSGGSNDRVFRTIETFLSTKRRDKVLVIIGWCSWEREEWEHHGSFYQVGASGTDSVPEALEEHYKKWVIEQTPEEHAEKQEVWHQRIWDLHIELKSKSIKHLFFNSYIPLDMVNNQLDWEDCYWEPYTNSYWRWCKDQGFQTVNQGLHYGPEAHSKWARYLLPRLTNVENSSNIVKVTQIIEPMKPKA